MPQISDHLIPFSESDTAARGYIQKGRHNSMNNFCGNGIVNAKETSGGMEIVHRLRQSSSQSSKAKIGACWEVDDTELTVFQT